MRQQPSDHEQGFTLIELLMAIMLGGIVVVALATGFVVAMKGTAGAHNRFVASNATQSLATAFTSDVESADPTTVSTTAATGTGCATTPTGTNVLRLQWAEWTTFTKMTAFSASYRAEQPTPGGEWQLSRYYCTAAQDPAPVGATASTVLLAVNPAPTSHVAFHNLSNPSLYPSVATVVGRKITLKTFAALSVGEIPPPYSSSISAKMRTPVPFPYVISIDRADPDPTKASTLHWTATFSEAVTGVQANGADFTLAPGPDILGASGLSVLPVAASGGKSYTVALANTGSGSDTLGLNLTDIDSISDIDGNKLGGLGVGSGNFIGQAYTVDRTPPTVTVEQGAFPQTDPTGTLPIVFDVTFSEPVGGLPSMVTRGGTALGGIVTVTGSRANYEISVSGLTGGGTVTAAIAAGKVTDGAGNSNTASTTTDTTSPASVTYTYTAAPYVQLIDRIDSDNTASSPLHWSVVFDQNVTGVDVLDFTPVSSGAVSGASVTGVAGGPKTYTVTVDRGTGAGTLGLNLIDDDSIKGGAVPLGGPGPVNGDYTGQTYQVVLTISSVQLLDANEAKKSSTGTLDPNDSIVVTFSKAMDLTSFCSGWTGSTKNGSGVVVTLNDGASGGNDSVTVAATGCGAGVFNFGTIDLGHAGYVSGGNATFSGSGSNASTIQWNAGTNQLRITLGTQGGSGIVANVAASTPVYTASAAIKDWTGAGVTNSPFTLPAGVQF